jgi:hypothetical protein
MDHHLRLTRKDGSIRYFHVFDRATPKDGDIVTLPVDGTLVKASVKGAPKEPEIPIMADAEAVEV